MPTNRKDVLTPIYSCIDMASGCWKVIEVGKVIEI